MYEWEMLAKDVDGNGVLGAGAGVGDGDSTPGNKFDSGLSPALTKHRCKLGVAE